MKLGRGLRVACFAFPRWILFGGQCQLPGNFLPGLYDGSKVPHYNLPDPLIFLNGQELKDAKT